jgi:hypothetical protein
MMFTLFLHIMKIGIYVVSIKGWPNFVPGVEYK